MKKIIRLLGLSLFIGIMELGAQTSCTDLNAYVDSKNTASTGYYTLVNGIEENAAQTYHYSGPGSVSGIRVYGNYQNSTGGVPLRVALYNVDINGRPTNLLGSTSTIWWWTDNAAGYLDVNLGGNIIVNNDFAVSVEVITGPPFGTSFQVKYTGDGEGMGEDLASLSGTSTGFNWTSAKNNFSKDGDFYIVPNITHFITSQFVMSWKCIPLSTNVIFTNTTSMSTDSMFNTIVLSNYSGSNNLYSWDFGDGSPPSNELNPTHTYNNIGTYTVTLTSMMDGWNTDCSDVYSTEISVGLSVNATDLSDVGCNGGTDGSMTAVGAGGKKPYVYSLDNFNFQSDSLFSGLNAGNYSVYIKDALGCSNSSTFTISEPTAINLNTSTTNASCGGSDGTILVTASGGIGALEYSLNSGSYQTSNSFTGIAAGSYTITVKDGNACTVTKIALVNDVGGPIFSSNTKNDVSCYGGSDGSINLNAAGGSGVLQYSINGGTTFQANASFSNVAAGNYSLVVKDAAGCIDINGINVLQPPMLSVSASTSAVSCNGGSDGEINIISAIGGTGIPTFSIDGVNFQSNSNFFGISAGTYVLTAKDVASCIATTTVTVNEPSSLSVSILAIPVTCNGDLNGSIITAATGGTSPYTYSINGISFQATGNFSSLAVDTYFVTVKDANNCKKIVSTTVTQPPAIAALITSTNSTCGNSDGGLLAVASGGSGSGYTYSLDGINYSASGAFSALASGSYFVFVKDGSGCQKVFSASIKDSDGPSITSISHTNVSCHNGNDATITVNSVAGGTGILNYSIDGDNWQLATSFTSLSEGTYIVLVKDNNGCIGDSVIVITEPNAIVITATPIVNVVCHGGNTGSATINAGGGVGALAYSINGGASFQASNIFSGLSVGQYTVMVRDAAGCTGQIDFSITEPNDITIFLGTLNVTCKGKSNGSINVTATGGTGALMFSMNGTTYQAGRTFSGLAGGNYVVYVKDASNCVKTLSFSIDEPEELLATEVISNVTCSGGNDGVIDITVSGGTMPYTIFWQGGLLMEDRFNLAVGTYTVYAVDANNCVFTKAYSITQPSNPLIVNGTVENASSSSAADGSIDVTVTGGTPPYSYNWSNSEFTEDITGLKTGLYTVYVTDASNCQTSDGFPVDFTTGVAGITNANLEIKMYPNPAEDYAFIESNAGVIQSLKVFDVFGQEIISKTDNRGSKINLDTQEMREGVYLIQITIGSKLITKKLSIVK